MASTAQVALADVDQRIAALFESSAIHETKGYLDKALGDVHKILGMDPNHYVANYRAGWLYYSMGRYTDSIRLYKKASSIKPRAIEPQLGLMLPLMASKQWGKAEALGEELLKKAPFNYLAGSRLAFIYFSQGKYQNAKVQYQKVLENFPSEIEMMLGLGWTYLKQQKKAEAREMFETVLSISKKNANALAGLNAF